LIRNDLDQDTMEEHIHSSALLVSVCPITYNHAKYFAQAIESVLAQQVDFEFEIIVGEDESSDGTREIALEFQRRFPDKIRVLLHSRKDVIYINGRATGRWNFVDTLSHARGKYIALLPCDDFWMDPSKLQKQVDVLEDHPEYSVCGHWIENVDENGEILDSVSTWGKACPEIFTVKRALTGTPLHPNSLLFRRFDLHAHPQYRLFLTLPAGDDPLMLMLLKQGNGYCIQKTMSAYRHHPGGTWSSKAKYYKDFEMMQFRIGALQLVSRRYVPDVLRIIYQSATRLFLDVGQEAIDTRSLLPFSGLLKLMRIQQTVPVYSMAPLFLLWCIFLPVNLMMRMGRMSKNKVRAMMGREL
jgi:glycosyltransferase involved in cell wall biosynthesis